jgi:rare lipoprotein A
MTVAGLLVGGAGTVINSGAPVAVGAVPDNAPDLGDAANAQPDRAASADRVSRATPRPTTSPTATPTPTPKTSTVDMGSCEASYYDEPQLTADGEQFNPDAMTAAHASLPFNTEIKVTNEANGKSVVVRINDRGPYVPDRCLDLSRAAFAKIANLSSGVVDVRYEILVQDAT